MNRLLSLMALWYESPSRHRTLKKYSLNNAVIIVNELRPLFFIKRWRRVQGNVYVIMFQTIQEVLTHF